MNDEINDERDEKGNRWVNDLLNEWVTSERNVNEWIYEWMTWKWKEWKLS